MAETISPSRVSPAWTPPLPPTPGLPPPSPHPYHMAGVEGGGVARIPHQVIKKSAFYKNYYIWSKHHAKIMYKS